MSVQVNIQSGSHGDGLPLGGVLAGGASRRFGCDKAAALLLGRPLAAWAASALRSVTDRVVLLGGDMALARRFGMERLPDADGGLGPLSGIASGLRRARELDRPGLVVVACDLPLVPGSVPAALVRASAEVPGGGRAPSWDVVVVRNASRGPSRVLGKSPVLGAGPAPAPDRPPLVVWLSSRVLPRVEERIASERRDLWGLIAGIAVRGVDVGPAVRGTLGSAAFLNVNRPVDLYRAEAVLRRRIRCEGATAGEGAPGRPRRCRPRSDAPRPWDGSGRAG